MIRELDHPADAHSAGQEGTTTLCRGCMKADAALALAVLIAFAAFVHQQLSSSHRSFQQTNPAFTMAGVSRRIAKSVLAVEKSEGVGAKVRRSIGGHASLRNLTPFLMLDHFHVSEGGFPDHPHRGMTTLTYMLTGSFQHEDFLGNAGRIDAGDLQFMIAGRGIMHSEMPVLGPGITPPTGLQLWIDLPRKHKLVEPSYQEMKASEVPTAHPSEGVTVKVISGKTLDAGGKELESPVRPLGGCWFFDVSFAEEAKEMWQPIPAGWNAFLYVLKGRVLVGEDEIAEAFHAVVLSNDKGEEGVKLTGLEKGAQVVVVAGEPLDQPVTQYGPVVMCSMDEVKEAFMDIQLGRNGFENAHAWQSKIGKGAH